VAKKTKMDRVLEALHESLGLATSDVLVVTNDKGIPKYITRANNVSHGKDYPSLRLYLYSWNKWSVKALVKKIGAWWTENKQ